MIGDYNRVSSTTLIPDMVDRLSDFQAQVFVRGIWQIGVMYGVANRSPFSGG